ncbi:hypothetical protein JCM9279_006976 [Rhodotorula babjevae]
MPEPQPPSPLLPSPISRLPRELLDQVFQDLQNIENGSERIDVGRSVSLVCRDWLDGGRRIVWAKITLRCDGVDQLAAKLAQEQNKLITASIRDLRIESADAASRDGTSVVSSGESGDDFGTALQVIERCSARLETLDAGEADIADGSVLDRIARSSAAHKLAHLEITVYVGPGCSLTDIVSALVRFVGLSRLILSLEWDGRGDLSQLPPMSSTGLRLKRLLIGDDQTKDTAVPVGGLGRALAPLWDPSTLRRVVLNVTVANVQDLAWLASLPRLQEVVLGTPYYAYFPAAFLPMVKVVKTLLSVEDVTIYSNMWKPDDVEPNFEDSPDSPIELDELLDSIPPNVKLYSIFGVVFEDRGGLSRILEQDVPTTSPRVEVAVKGGIVGDPNRVVLVREIEDNGLQVWSVQFELPPAEANNAVDENAGDGAADERDSPPNSNTSI